MDNENNTIQILPTETYFALIRQMLSDNGQAYVRITGKSMWPLLRHLQDGVIIVPPEDICIGDIVLFDRLNGRYALHRVIRRKKESFTMAGDNQWFSDNDLPYDQIIGVVTCIDRNGHRISCNNIFIKSYSRIAVFLAMPRIFARKAFVWVRRSVKSVCRSARS